MTATKVATIGVPERTIIRLDEWVGLPLEDRSALMERDVYPILEGPAAAELGARVGHRIRPRHAVKIPGMGGRFYDFRNTGLLPPSGGRIRVLVAVEHIPVIRQMPGIDDAYVLANVLNGQDLSLQAWTDAHGNAGQFNYLDRLCWQARGANAISYGVEHMHLTVSEDWTERQFRAAAYIAWRGWKYQGVPLRGGWLGSGNGYVTVRRTGHVGHKAVSDKAGYHDRQDPGPGFRWGHVYNLAEHYNRRRRF